MDANAAKAKLTTVGSWAERVLIGMSGLFLVAYAWPILNPDLDPRIETVCDWVLVLVWIAFLLHYLIGLFGAEQRLRWFGAHLFDLLLILVPFLRPLRILQVVLLLRMVNSNAKRQLRGQVGAYVAVGSALLAFVAALAVLDAERGTPDALITTFPDALWWAVVTMTTVGYGDLYPVTTTGRVVAGGLMVAGIGFIGSVTATLASWMIDAVAEQEEEDERVEAAEHAAELEVLKSLRAEVSALRREIAAQRSASPPRDGGLT